MATFKFDHREMGDGPNGDSLARNPSIYVQNENTLAPRLAGRQGRLPDLRFLTPGSMTLKRGRPPCKMFK